jgi:cobalt transporter subunit CbtB
MIRDDSKSAAAATEVPDRPAIEAGRRTTALVPALAAALLGFFVIYGAGFAGASVLHNAAHDVRHSDAFPCH